MGLFGNTISDSWKFTKTSLKLVLKDRVLLTYPLIAGLAGLGVIALTFLGLLFSFPFATRLGSNYDILLAVVFIGAYFLLNFIGVYATGALVGASMMALNGQKPTRADGWAFARKNLTKLLVWSILASTLGLIIQAIEQRLQGILGLIVGIAAQAAWTLVTYFMVPILIFESEPLVLPAFKRSFHLYWNNIGRNVLSNLALNLIMAGGIILAFVLGFIGVSLALGGFLVVGLILACVGLALGVFFLILSSAANAVLVTALYRYATTGKVDPDLIPPEHQQMGSSPSPAGSPLPSSSGPLPS